MDEKRNTKSNKKHPMERANALSLAFFCWMIPYFVKGFKRELNEDDVCEPLKTHDAKRLGDAFEMAWNYEIAHKRSPSLWKAILKVFKMELIVYAILIFLIEFTIRLSQPLLLAKLMQYYEPNQTVMSRNEAYTYSVLIVIFCFLNIMSFNSYQLRAMQLGMKIRIAVCSLIYRKSLKLSKLALAETTIGQMVNLLSNDVSRLDFSMQFFQYLWVAPIETIAVMCLLYWFVGPAGLAGTVFLLLFIPFQMYTGKKISQFRLRTAIRTDERVRLMSEIISGIEVIKMYTWEIPFAKLIQISRVKEIHQIWATSIIRAIMASFNLVLNRIAIFLCILTFVFTGNALTASYAYTVVSFYGVLKTVIIMFFPQAVAQLAETNVSINRIEKFLLYDEIYKIKDVNMESKKQHCGFSSTLSITQENGAVGIYLRNVSAKWLHSLAENALENITFSATSKELIAVVGTVGGGKTTLLHAILGELPAPKGSINVQGTISYASQEPWLFGGSVRQNIIFGQAFNQNKYDEVVRVCALERDFTLFPYGDRTLVGDRGVTLSGGQRARINLARAIYKDADIYLLDDPLSAVDAHVGKQLLDNCICKYLKEKCVVLVTHQLQYLSNTNKIYLLENGKIEAFGSYSEIKAAETKFTKLLAHNEEENEKKSERCKLLERKDDDENNGKGTPVPEEEARRSGTVSWSVYKSYLQAGGSWLKALLLFFTFIITQIAASLTDYFVSIWCSVEQWRSEQEVNKSNISENVKEISTATNLSSESKLSRQYFLSSILTDRISITIYGLLVCTTMVLAVSRSIAFFRYCMVASRRLHLNMLNKIVHASMRFFNTNPTGRILNRFSKDIGAVDETLPLTIVDTLQIGLTVLANSIVIGSINPWTFLPTLIMFVIFYCIRLVFLATSRDIKRIEAVTRSPIYTHLSASLQGLPTIRAFGAQNILKVEFDNYQDKYSAAYFMFLSANRTFAFWLDFHCVIYTALVLISILFVEREILGGSVGLALTQSIGFMGMFQSGMRQWSELENQMTSVERVEEYINITPEVDEKTKIPPKFWPEEGAIKFINLWLRYPPDEPYVLKDLTFEVKPKEKVGIVGRTGAGKSSLIAALFHLAKTDGKIVIDNVDTKEVSLHALRSKISIIPQEPVLFSGSVRKNLDPFDEREDEVLWNALREVELESVISDLPAGLDSKMSEGGYNFSVGQRQLLCLARAIIRNNKILIMDEATANVDPYTDGFIQNTIRKKFADCTVLTVAHRLHTIMDSDKVLVMDSGRIAEFDNPFTLLQNSNGIFYGLVQQTGKAMAEKLTSIAEGTFKSDNIY